MLRTTGATPGATTDAGEDLGARLRRLRRERGLSQADLTRHGLSASYVSRVESGERRPSRAALDRLAAALDCSPTYLLEGADEQVRREQELELRYAELALHNGEAEEALDRYHRLRGSAQAGHVRERAAAGHARALEATGRLEDAIVELEALLERHAADPGSESWLGCVIALCRCYREVGDLGRSVDLGEHAVHRLAELGLPGSDLEIELVATLAFAHLERGDLVRADQLLRATLGRAERLGTHRARAAVYWNASIVAQERGRTAEALQLVERALALLGDAGEERNLARLRNAHASLLLQQEQPRAEEALELLLRARTALLEVGSAVDVAYCDTEIARARTVLDDPAGAREAAHEALRRLGGQPRLEHARATIALADALAAHDDTAARATYQRAADELAGMGASRQAAVVWRQLADALLGSGDRDGALDAYRRAADSAGLLPWKEPARQPVPATPVNAP